MDDTVLKERQVFGGTFDQYPATTTIDPEFQRVAQMNKYMWLYQKGNEDENVAGVLSLDPVFLQALLGATGEVKLSDGRVLDDTTTVPFFFGPSVSSQRVSRSCCWSLRWLFQAPSSNISTLGRAMPPQPGQRGRALRSRQCCAKARV